MRLSTKGRYAVMAMADLALHGAGCGAEGCARGVPLSDIAARQEISLSYLEQLFARLRRAGLVESARGPGGGYRLTRCSEQISVGAIVHAVDEPIEAVRCTLSADGRSGRGCMPGGERCLTHDLWAALGDHIERFLAGVTLADVAERRLRPQQLGLAAE